MSIVVLYKFLVIVAIVVLGILVGRLRWLGSGDVGRVLSGVTFMVFAPALLFRTAARIDFEHLQWRTLLAYFGTVVAFMLVVYTIERRRMPADSSLPAAPAVRAVSSVFGNTVQVGIPIATALFGEAGLSLHLTIVSLHALTLMTILTVLVELDLAHAHARSAGSQLRLGTMLLSTVRNTVIHPIVLPVLCGLGWNLWGGGTIAPPIDEFLLTLGQAVVPLSLFAIGLSLAHSGVRGAVRRATEITVFKLLVQPALVLVVAHWGFGLSGLPLMVTVMCAALPTGSNATMFSIRYRTLEREVNTAVVISTTAFVLAAPLWIYVVGRVAP
jgi:malonate transporter